MARVLVVEDSAAMRAFVRAALEDDTDAAEPSIEVVEASSGFEALRLLPRGPYDCVITDVNMPDINGLELVNFIRRSEHHKTTPLVIISTQASERDKQRGIALGADSYLAKPFEPEDLRRLVRAHLDKRAGR
ncbi:MAG: response regulator [Sandaracinaceae bacterium]|nr:response regulator [Sandaracinaceae bacterium]